jgi:hypothetical protein
MRFRVDYLVALSLAAIAVALPAVAQVAPQSTVEQAAFARDASGAVPQSIRFDRQPPHVGDQVEQNIMLEMRLATALRQNNELLEKNEMKMRNTQRRLVTTTEIVDGRTQAVLVRYPAATKQHAIGADARKSFDAPATPQTEPPAAQPVQGKAYLCRREPGDDGKLVITDEAGLIPPLEEYEIVAQGMDMVGRANPLADFLAGRSVAVGQTLTLPPEVADRLFGIQERFGDITRFALTLQEIRPENGAARAVFLASIDAASSDSSQMRLQVEGPLVIEIDSCRAVHTKLSGPIGMTESRGTYSTAYQLISTGQLAMMIDAHYRDTAR